MSGKSAQKKTGANRKSTRQESAGGRRTGSSGGGASRKSGSAGNSKATRRTAGGQTEATRTPRVKRRKKRGWKRYILLLMAAFFLYEGWVFLHRPTGIWTVAVFGVDSRDGNTKNALADVQMLCSIDRSTGEIRLVSVYRDTYLKIDSKGTYHKINEAYFKGGHKQAISALEENLDIKIDDYATFNWKAVAQAINVLGGVDIELTDAEFGQINGFITETVNSTGIGSVQLTQPGLNHLDGVQAVAYSRLRLMDTDFKRTERQRKVITLALEKAKQADASTLAELVKAILPQISTSISVNDVLPMVKDVSKYDIGETGGFPFSRQTARVGRMDCVIPTTLESNVILLHQFLYGEETSYSPSRTVKNISAHISEETGFYEEGKAAPSGGSGGAGSSGGSGGGNGGNKATQQTEPAAETETTAEETIEETTEESADDIIIDELETEEEQETEAEIGPGISGGGTQHPEATEEETMEQGPGVDGNHGSQKPTDRPGGTAGSTEQGPGAGGSNAGSGSSTNTGSGSNTGSGADNSGASPDSGSGAPASTQEPSKEVGPGI